MGPTLELNYNNTITSGTGQNWLLDTVRIYVPGPDGIIGAREFHVPAGGTEKALVYHYDHLGSITATTDYGAATITNDGNNKPGKFSEDAWGQRRNPDSWTGAPNPAVTDDGGANSVTPRGYTGHEMLDDLGLVHMNGRIYDPLLGRFLSADPTIPDRMDLQSYNRYSYCRNNPLSKTDPTGFADEPVADEFTTVVQPLVNRQEAWKNDPMHPVKDFGRAVGANSTVEVSHTLEGNKVDVKPSVSIPLNDPKGSSVSVSTEVKKFEVEGTVSKDGASGSVTRTLPSGATVTIVDGKMTLRQGTATSGSPQPATSASQKTSGPSSAISSIVSAVKSVISSVVPNAFNSVQIPGTPVTVTVGATPAVAVTVGNTTVKASTDLNKAQESMKKDDGSQAAEMQRRKEEEEKKKKTTPNP